MDNLMVKEVNFHGDTLLAVKKDNEKIYVSVSYICDGIGLTDGQKKRQVNNIRKDVVLKQGSEIIKIDLYNTQNRELLCLELDFLPLWLAKISITPKMKNDSPEVVDKLVEYQLKAKDVLANAFIHNVTQIVPKTYKEALIALVESIEEKEKLEAENQLMAPKVESYNTFIDGSNYQKMNDVAKSVGYNRNKLFKFLRDKNILMKDNLPYQTYMNRRYFVVKETPIHMGNFITNKPQTFVTSKGVNFISKLLKENNLI